MKESEIVRSMLKILNQLPHTYALRTHGGSFQLKGTPDILGCAFGHFFAIEAKRSPNLKPSEAQKFVLDKFSNAYGKTFVSCDPKAEEVVKWINSLR